YRTTAGVEGGVAGAGGFVLAAADLPALMAIKVQMLGDVVGAYGWGGGTVRERLFVLHIFHLAFAGAKRRPEALAELERWIAGADQPQAVADYDWRRFQIEYRDYIDLAKMAQLIPVVGAPIGAVVNWRLVDRLGETAIMACRMRWMAEADA
ncbi:MAG: EcsC family protein, partial [Brevundimonas sp.]